MSEDAAQDEFEIITTAQVERTYKVLASSEEQAHKRLRTFLADPDMIRQDLVQMLPDRQIDSTPQRVKSEGVTKIPRPRAVKTEEPRAGATG